jgi:hypothetical protein
VNEDDEDEHQGEAGEAATIAEPPPAQVGTRARAGRRPQRKPRRPTRSRAPRDPADDVEAEAPAEEAAGDEHMARLQKLERELAEARRKLAEKEKKGRGADEELEEEHDPEDDLPIQPDEEKGPTPIELVVSDTSPFLRVSREEANLSGEGASDYTGFLGIVPHRLGFESVIRRRWGGGTYEVNCVVKGKKVARAVILGGPSLPPDEEQDARAQEQAMYDQWYAREQQAAQAQAQQVQVDAFGRPIFQQPAQQGGWPPQQGGWPPAGPQQPAPGQPWNPAAAAASAYTAPRPFYDTEEGRAMRDELEATRAQAALAREEARLAQVAGAAQVREEALKRELDAIRAKVEAGPPGGGMADVMKLMFHAQEQRAKEEAAERNRRIEEDRIAREEQRAREEKRAAEDRDRWERERKERLDREDRERKDREEARREENARHERERKAAEAAFERMQATMAANQQKPSDLIETMLKVKELTGGGDDAVDKVLKIVEASQAMREALGVDGGGPPEEGTGDKVVKVLKGLGDALTPAVSEVTKMWREQREEKLRHGQRLDLGSVTPQPQALPAPAEHGGQQAPQPQAQQGPAAQPQAQPEPTINGLTARQWNKVLEHVVDQHGAGVGPEEAARDLLLVLKAIDGMQGLEKIATTTPDALCARVKLLRLSGKVSETKALWYMDTFTGKVCAGKAEWLAAFIGHAKRFYDVLVARAKAQQAAQAAQEKAEQAKAVEAERQEQQAEDDEAEAGEQDEPEAPS